MDTSRKTLTDRNTCNFCIHYQQKISNSGKKLCRGKCRVTGTYKQRTNYKCKKNFQDNGQPIRDDYDYILIDCSPSLGLITVNALTAADSVIIPVQCEYFALEGISKLLNTIKIIKSKLNTRLEIEGFLLTMYDGRLRLANQIYYEVKRHFQELVFKTVIQRNVKLSESPSHGLPVILYDADSTGSKNHLALAKEIINKNEKTSKQ